MTVEEIKTYLEENKDSEDVKAFLKTLRPEITLGTVKQFCTDNQDGKDWLAKQINSEADSRVTKALKTYEAETLPNKVNEAIKKANPGETEEQKQIRELRDKIETAEAESKREKLKSSTLTKLASRKLDSSLLDLVIGRDEETTDSRIATLENLIKASIENGVKDKFKDGGGNPPGGGQSDLKSIPNPWKKETFNLTKQGEILIKDPELAKKLKAEAGK